jgi:hypothetical protein
MKAQKRFRLQLEELEQRDVPSHFGIATHVVAPIPSPHLSAPMESISISFVMPHSGLTNDGMATPSKHRVGGAANLVVAPQGVQAAGREQGIEANSSVLQRGFDAVVAPSCGDAHWIELGSFQWGVGRGVSSHAAGPNSATSDATSGAGEVLPIRLRRIVTY